MLGRRADDGAAQAVGVAVEVLGRRVHHNVRAERQRALQHRRHECVVDAHFGALRVRNLCHAGNIREHHQRIRRRLNVHKLGIRLHRLLNRGQIAGVDIFNLDAIARHNLVEEPHRARVNVQRANHVVAGAQHGNERRNCSHAGSEHVSAGAALKRGHRGLKTVARGVAGP